MRERISFRAGNLLDPALTNQTAYDFVFCRNLLIYFDQPTQKHVFEVLKRLTRDDGILFIGPAEGSLLTRMGMRSIGIPQTFAFIHYSAPQEPVALPAEPSPRSAIVPPGFNPEAFRVLRRDRPLCRLRLRNGHLPLQRVAPLRQRVETTLRHCSPPSPALPTKAKR